MPQIKNILVVRNDRFGEFLLNLPAIEALKRKFPAAQITLVVSEQTKELIEALDYVDNFLVWDNQKNHSFFEKLRFLKTLRRFSFDLAIVLNPSKEFHIFAYLAGIPKRIGYARKCGFLLTDKIPDLKYLGLKHEIEYNLDLAKLAGVDNFSLDLSLAIKEKHLAYIEKVLRDYGIAQEKGFIALHPWTSDSAKQWPVEKFKELARRILEDLKIKLVLIGGKDEEINAQGFLVGLCGIINFTGKFSLLESAALLKKANLLVSNDSGPVHLAAAVKTPVVAIFSNKIPAKSSRRWGPWGQNHIVIEKEDLRQICVEEVLQAINTILER